ncbi:hypothetical protein [Myroides sp. N17-2]|uniref:hypothetical protein n=1 Tax=Myroides sp. N17-2 TaxID=2030799 RepID=UPI000EFD9E61|nr:hypothetical protein [Myroides sp. N17-2]
MKKLITLFTILLSILLTSCSGSDVYRGQWYATNADGEQFTILFDENNFKVTNQNKETEEYPYSQNTYKSSNSVVTYGIKLKDGRNLSIHFPIAKNDQVGYIMSPQDQIIFTISRTGYTNKDDIYKLGK